MQGNQECSFLCQGVHGEKGVAAALKTLGLPLEGKDKKAVTMMVPPATSTVGARETELVAVFSCVAQARSQENSTGAEA